MSFLFYASALEGGSVTVAVAAVVLVETVPPAAVGVLLLGDKTRHGLAGVAIAGFILAVISAVMLARFGQSEHEGLAQSGIQACAVPGQRPAPRDQVLTPQPWARRQRR